ncbi:helix-turn-helix domain-containing protein [Streptomyces sp. NPDC127098]|uniref:helix-turn-helix domain-containing protein n=1 Tax=Streptomyces sp. NPDC127098 TaxID=3347137 RepID=UPI003647A933
MSADTEIADLAALLEELKGRSGLSYGTLAKRLHLSASTVHRYCKGDGLPPEFATVERFARLCKARPEELVELHRRWIAADTAREREREQRVPAQESPAVAPVVAEEPAPREPPAPSARRRWRPALVAGALALTATLTVSGGLLLAAGGDDESDGTNAAGTTETTETTETGETAPADPTEAASPEETAAAPTGPDDAADAEDAEGTEDPAGEQPPPGGEGPAPVTVATRAHAFENPCGNHYLVDAEPESVPPPPDEPGAPGWARAMGAVSAEQQYIELTVQAAADETVVLRDLSVRVTRTGDPLPWNLYTGYSACGGGPVETTAYDVDLDAATPQATAAGGQPELPLWVDETDPLVVYVTAHTDTRDVEWYLELAWTSGEREGVLVIDDEGQPFHTSATSGQPEWAFPLGGTEWYASDAG